MTDYELYRKAYRDYVIMSTPSMMQDIFGGGDRLEPPLPPPMETPEPCRTRPRKSSLSIRRRPRKIKAKNWSVKL